MTRRAFTKREIPLFNFTCSGESVERSMVLESRLDQVELENSAAEYSVNIFNHTKALPNLPSIKSNDDHTADELQFVNSLFYF